ncbi:CsbD family protein [Streptomyces sp. R302]|uniref:CsbD family protein n=1 Tax=unclassified Streptomyces TaxID=2593676 RepID=UPI00145F7D0A|nr:MULTISPECIES: CsbD family protein [unclassified Streptomyces]NML52704.1 CsbD family protein [Streptomyces sp. R301]NML80367.1 CsbD family protein [Streptomyces sp. R302]
MGSAVDKARGRFKELAGRFTGDKRLEAEGRTDQAKAKARGAVRSLRERARGVMDSVGRS